ncbi:FAD-dependent monooxygenase [Sphaerisporangium corydalis]|uniref:FAD-dependent monooxygenase n=1 Tax=Sphaerisporangium corydalis TaxID=1441875 RepID=A0ABV9ENT3_9ACTN|nr:FAD-dependent monooxygenase [Sphaerisporangium corydalis]
MNHTQVLIAGAGPTGLTLAVDLARRGVAFRIVDAAPAHPTGSRGKGLQPRTLEVFDDLGVIEPILATGAPYPVIRAYSGAEVVWEGRMHQPADPTPAVPYPMVVMQPQWRTERILRDRLAWLGGHVEMDTEVTAFEQDADGVTVTLDGPGGVTELVRADYLAGADGGGSRVRKLLGVGFAGETFETERMLIGDVTVPGLDREHWHTWADPATRRMGAGLCPLPGTDVFQFTAQLKEGEVAEATLAGYQRMLDDARGDSTLRLGGVSWTSTYRVNIRMAERFRRGRVFLAGDAAHVHSPAGGQGLNTGVQDAYNLGWKLGRVLGGAPAALLDTYEEERLPVAAGVLGLSTALYQKARRGDQDATDRGEDTNQLLLSYHGSSLATIGTSAGDRAPDAPCRTPGGEATRLFDVFRGPHTTVLRLGGTAAVAGAGGVVVREVGTDLIDDGGHVRDAYGDQGFVVVRPDGYIGAATTDPSEVEGHLHALGSH